MKMESIEVVADRTQGSRCDEGFLRLRRFVLRNHYSDGTQSAEYPCDIVSRPHTDAVVCVLYAIEGQGPTRRVRVVLRENSRPAIYLRKHRAAVQPDDRVYTSIREVPAGLIEDDDHGAAGLARRAATEALEETGYRVDPGKVAELGGPNFASPGISDEKVFYCVATVDLERREEHQGDGSVMEEWGRVVVMELGEAIRACRRGDIPDMKTELALCRLADHVGYLPLLDRFADPLPASAAE